MAEASDREDRLQALYGLRKNVAETIAVEDDAARAIVAAVDSLIQEYEGAPPSEAVRNTQAGEKRSSRR